MSFAVIIVVACLGGFTQGVTGFGGGIMLMLFLPSLYGMVIAPALSDLIMLPALGLMAWRYRSTVQPMKAALPTAVYLLFSSMCIFFAKGMTNLKPLQAAFGLFLLLLAAYFVFVAPNLQLKASVPTALACGAVSGITGGLFGIGGPLMALYFLTTSRDRNEYLANNCLYLVLTVASNDIIRLAGGIVEFSILPVAIGGGIAAIGGLLAGESAAKHMNAKHMKQCVYLLMAFAGVVTLCKGIGVL